MVIWKLDTKHLTAFGSHAITFSDLLWAYIHYCCTLAYLYTVEDLEVK